jgi:hypothetical protein
MTATDICRVVTAVLSLLSMYGSGQKVDLPHGLWVNCDAPSGKNAVVVGPTVTAKNGSRAWVQVVSVVAPLEQMCLNTTTLWVSRGHLHPYLPIFTQSPVYPNLEGNGMQIVDWSPDGRLLLTEMWQWNTEPNDAPIPRSILVFEPKKKTKHLIDIYRLLDDQKGRDCEVHFDLFGFTPDDWVAIKVRISTFYDVDEDETTKPKNLKCRESTHWLAINPFTQARRSIPSDFHAARYSNSN